MHFIFETDTLNTPEWCLINKDSFSSIRLTQTTEWVLLEFTLNPKPNLLNICQQHIPSHAPGKRFTFSHCCGLVTHPALCFTQNFCVALFMLWFPWLFVSQAFPSHSYLAILYNGTNNFFSRASSIQCEVGRARWMGSLHSCSLCTELYTKRQQITTNKKNYARHLISFKELNSFLYNPCYQIIYTRWNTGQLFKRLLPILLRKTMTSSDKTENHNSVFPVQS